MTSQCDISGKNHICSVKHRTLQSIKKGYRTSGILARGYRRKDLLTHFFLLRTLIFLRNYLRGSKQIPKENTSRINILQVTWWRFPINWSTRRNYYLSRTSITMPFDCYICFLIIANTFILIKIFGQETKMSIAPKHDYWCENYIIVKSLEMTVVEPSTPGRVLQIKTQFQTQFKNVIFHIRFQTWPLRYHYLD